MSLKRTPPTVREQWADLFARDVLDNPGTYDVEVLCDPRNWAMRIVAGLDEPEVRRMIQDLRAERRNVARLAKGGAS